MNKAIKILSALGMIFAGIGQMLTQYNEIMQRESRDEEDEKEAKK